MSTVALLYEEVITEISTESLTRAPSVGHLSIDDIPKESVT